MEYKKQIIDHLLLDVMLSRLCQQLLETHRGFENTVILGLQPRGIFLAERISARLRQLTGNPVPLGYLDTTFHRDDFRRRSAPLTASTTKVPFLIEDKKVVLIDDVLYTGRTVRAALDAMITFGRPSKVELLVLISRKYARDLPIEPDYVGRSVNTLDTQRVVVSWQEQGDEEGVWLSEKQQDKA
ncbi:MAG: bifunctional pyr operon transcriptional regulator/uracil phosphoribosyltransferase PyrR [Cyclobacteriaceae bacterium]